MLTQAIYRAMVLVLSVLLVACSGSVGGSVHTLSARPMVATNIVPTAESAGTANAALNADATAGAERGDIATEYGSRLASASELRSDCINRPDIDALLGGLLPTLSRTPSRNPTRTPAQVLSPLPTPHLV